MELKTKLYLLDEDGEKFMGMGVYWLLEAVDHTSSLRKAAESMDISYSKAYRMVNNLERVLGKEVIDRRKGGSDRQGATLTPFGRRFYQLYGEFQTEAKKMLNTPYEGFKKELAALMEENNG
jgi:N-terminal domain of molybdenum-binding protein